jgi:sugar-specific transcriptional regulator TrmB
MEPACPIDLLFVYKVGSFVVVSEHEQQSLEQAWTSSQFDLVLEDLQLRVCPRLSVRSSEVIQPSPQRISPFLLHINSVTKTNKSSYYFTRILCNKIYKSSRSDYTMAIDQDELIHILTEQIGLTPYEARGYIAVLFYGPLSPTGVNQKSGIPRPRAYDVLNSLVGKGLLMEQPGKPSKYLAVDPAIGLKKLMEELEDRTNRQIKQQWGAVEELVSSLSGPYTSTLEGETEENLVWVTRRDSAMIARYSEAIRNVDRSFIIATALTKATGKEILAAVKHALKKKKSFRAIRPIHSDWSKSELEMYEELINLGDDIRHLEYDGLSFAIFDEKDVVIWLPPYPSTRTVWIKLPLLAEILLGYFESLWKRSEPALPLIEMFLKEKSP